VLQSKLAKAVSSTTLTLYVTPLAVIVAPSHTGGMIVVSVKFAVVPLLRTLIALDGIAFLILELPL
jgi:hypothetical protein